MRRIILQPGEQFTNAHLKRTDDGYSARPPGT